MVNLLSKEEKLIAACDSIVNILPKFTLALQEGRTNERFMSMTFSGYFESLALKAFFIDSDINLSKSYFHNGGMIDILLTTKYDEKVLDSGLHRLGYALLSDNKQLIDEYAHLKHSNFENAVESGNTTGLYVLQCLITENWSEFERAMEIVRTKSVPKFKMELDAQYYSALAEKNKEKIEQLLAEFVSPKMHNARNKHQGLVGEFISQPAITYAKLAWFKGIPVRVDSALVPAELLPVSPLPVYEKIDLLNGKSPS
jgi:hypothetical protein